MIGGDGTNDVAWASETDSTQRDNIDQQTASGPAAAQRGGGSDKEARGPTAALVQQQQRCTLWAHAPPPPTHLLEADGLGIAAALDVEHAVVPPAMLVIPDQRPLGVG